MCARKLKLHLEDIKAGRAPADGSGLQEVWDFSHFDPKHIDFLLATLGEGEVRIKLFGGEAKAGDTSVPGLWRVQSGRSGPGEFLCFGTAAAYGSGGRYSGS